MQNMYFCHCDARKMWQATAGIPCGKVATYGGLAAALGSSSRAVGQVSHFCFMPGG